MEDLQDQRNRQRSVSATVGALLIAGLVTACTDVAKEPTSPVADSPIPVKGTGSLVSDAPVAPRPSRPHSIVVEQGQSLDRIARSHHVTPAALAAANHLQPPYKIKVGLRLVLPDSGSPPFRQANAMSDSPAPSFIRPSSQPAAAAVSPPAQPSAAPLNGPPNESAAPQSSPVDAQIPPLLPRAPPVLPPRNPAAALPLPGEAP